ncbi:SymE family type I addiction module toxin [Paraburkholderia silviterrae]|uniref:Type I toxin-antitoxin system SymE family toxin n=1 Tax=Paraburkholderia silviterrae TaxID=2528715 RepID=A0A4R5MGK8_9BURK|nr:type I toxin-antitoxin system SymE family toxin [Paraburkholderia silviterrae]
MVLHVGERQRARHQTVLFRFRRARYHRARQRRVALHVDVNAPPLYPWIKLSGRWLELAGFEAGQRVRIEVQHGRLVTTPD